MHIHPLLLFSLGLTGVIIGRLLFGRWFNHLSLYSLIWGTGLSLFELGWIDYEPLTVEAWLLIGYAWLAFAAGSAIVILARRAIGISSNPPPVVKLNQATYLEKRYLMITVVMLCIIAFLGVVQHWMVLIGRFGSIAGVLLNGGIIYSLRTSGQLTGLVPYVDSLALIAACLAGIYCAKAGGIKLIGLFPLLIIMLDEIGTAARAKLLTAGLLFLSAYFIAKVAPTAHIRTRRASRIRRFLPMFIVLAVLILGAESVRGLREGTFRYYGLTTKFEKYPYVPASLYLYFSAHPGTLNAYLKAEDKNLFPGSYTLAPLYRIFVRFGLADPVPPYPKFYNIPIPVNTGTYLLEIHAEYGIVGVLMIPYLLGLVSTMMWLKIRKQGGIMSIVLLSHIYVVIAVAFALPATGWGFLQLSLFVSLFFAIFIKQRSVAVEVTRQSPLGRQMKLGDASA